MKKKALMRFKALISKYSTYPARGSNRALEFILFAKNWHSSPNIGERLSSNNATATEFIRIATSDDEFSFAAKAAFG